MSVDQSSAGGSPPPHHPSVSLPNTNMSEEEAERAVRVSMAKTEEHKALTALLVAGGGSMPTHRSVSESRSIDGSVTNVFHAKASQSNFRNIRNATSAPETNRFAVANAALNKTTATKIADMEEGVKAYQAQDIPASKNSAVGVIGTTTMMIVAANNGDSEVEKTNRKIAWYIFGRATVASKMPSPAADAAFDAITNDLRRLLIATRRGGDIDDSFFLALENAGKDSDADPNPALPQCGLLAPSK